MNYEYSEWTQIRVTVKTPFLDRLTAIMSVVDTNLMIEDYSDFNLHGMYGELADDTILNADRTVASVSVFLPAEENPDKTLSFIRDRIAADGIEAQIAVADLNEADWVNNWKQYYKPLHIGKKTVIIPKWEKYEAAAGEICVRMDPGMAFGTGSHETTRSIIEMLEENVKPGDSVLDVGTGSGILGICAMKLGGISCCAYDIAPIAVEVAEENFAENGISSGVECGVSDLLAGVKQGKYDIICANIVADIIIRMLPDISVFMNEGTRLFLSGIISERCDEVCRAVTENSLKVCEIRTNNGWAAIKVSL